ncbi:MAG: NAD(+)/NADH kinase [Patescibacteria group bacterium]|nr:NAD(+)/NADH kinase [Patescibacteria group bacterium]
MLYGSRVHQIEPLVRELGFEIATGDPEFVITYGGDGGLMRAEGKYPGVPKILLKDSAICKKCSPLPNDEILRRIKERKFTIDELEKLEVTAHGKVLYAVNDVVIHNQDTRHAMRYQIAINGKAAGGTIIGDGIVAATPFGSTAYYRSITDSFFEVGIGLAFNNSTEQSDHMVLKADSVITLTVVRGPAMAYADNQEEELVLAEGDSAVIRKSAQKARIVVPDIG